MRLALRTVAVVFMVFGAFWGAWAVAAADVQRDLHLSPGGLGLLLSGSVGVGGLAAAATGTLAERWGPRVFLARALALWALAAVAAGIVSSGAVFVVFFVVAMVGAGLVDMAMNAGAAAGVGGDARRMMQFHALFNAGALCGAAVAGALIGAGRAWHWSWVFVGATGLVIAGGLAWATSADGPETTPARPGPSVSGTPSVTRSLAILRSLHLTPLALAFVATAGVEGGIDTWGVLYLRRQLAVGILLGAGAYGVGQVIAVTVRAGGAGPIGRVGPRWGLVAGAGTAAVGLLLESLSSRPGPAAAGLALAAAGIAVCWPLAMSAVSGRAATEGVSPAPLVGALTASGYVGWVAGPAVVGLVADAGGLRAGLLILASLAAAACAGLARVPVAAPAR